MEAHFCHFDIAVIHLGIINLLNTTGTKGLLQNIVKITARCKTHGICKIFVSSVLHTGKVPSDMIAKLNLDIANICKSNSRGGTRTTETSKMERFVLLSQSAPSWMLQQP